MYFQVCIPRNIELNVRIRYDSSVIATNFCHNYAGQIFALKGREWTCFKVVHLK